MTISRLPRILATFGIGLVLTACDEEPSYQVRWRISDAEGTGDAARLERAAQCSRVGIAAVEISTFDDDRMVDQRVVPCFPSAFEEPAGTVSGPSLPSGAYSVVLRGLRRDGAGWFNPLLTGESPTPPADRAPRCESTGAGASCPPEYIVCACDFVELESDSSIVLDEFVLDPPGECVDGIDNDRDGLVDAFDPGCRNSGSETDAVSTVQVRAEISFLGGNENAQCSALGVSEILVTLDGTEIARPSCTTGSLFLTVDAAAGARELGFVAIGRDGNPMTRPQLVALDIAPNGGFFDISVDFGDTDFLEPISGSSSFLPRFVPYDRASQSRGCEPGRFGLLELTGVRLRVLDAHGGPLAQPVTLEDGTVLDGETVLPCIETILETQVLSWGGYLLEVEALNADGDVCFSNAGAPAPLAPGEPFVLSVPRVLVSTDGEDGNEVPPPGCEDCQADSDCPESTCEDGMCRLSGD